MPDYRYLDSFDNLGNHLKEFGQGLDAEAEKKKKRGYDEGYLDWLRGVTAPKAPVDIPAPPPLEYGQHTGDAPIQGPEIQPFRKNPASGMQEPDPSVAPTDMAQGLPGGAPFSNDYLENPGSLIEAQKAKAQQASEDLFSDPNQTMNMLIEAKKRGVSEDMGSLLEFIAKQHQASESNKFRAEETDKAQKARAAETDKLIKGRAETQESREAQQETAQTRREEFQRQRDDFQAAHREKLTGMRASQGRGRAGPMTSQDYNAMSPEDLDALSGLLDEEEAGISDPEAPTSRRDVAGQEYYRQTLRANNADKARIRKDRHLVEQAKALKEARSAPGGSAPARSPAPAPAAPGPAAGPSRTYSSKQEILQAKASGQLQSGQKVSTPYGIVTVP